VKAHSFYAEPYAGIPRPDRKSTREALSRTINLHVAQRVKRLRLMHGETQTQLGEALDLTFQQVAKYEKGISRLPPDRLWLIADHYEVEITHFFEGIRLENEILPDTSDGRRGDSRLRIELADAIQSIESARMLRSLLGLIRAM
jgi:transcriptional regulator with XRE-family HTH domain